MKGKPTLLFTSDWHLRSTTPSCRKDDFYKAILKKIRFVFETASSNQVPIVIAGDIGHSSEWDMKLLYDFLNIKDMYSWVKVLVIEGQHDLVNHRKSYYSGVGVLNKARAITIINSPFEYGDSKIFPFPYGSPITEKEKVDYSWKRNIAVLHDMVIKNPLWDKQKAQSGKDILKKNSGYDLIVCGDNHNPFMEMYNGRKLINCGSLMRQTTDQKNHKPRIYLWYEASNSIDEIYIPIDEDVFVEEEIVIDADKEIELFVKSLMKQGVIGNLNDSSFEAKLRGVVKDSEIRQETKIKIYKVLERLRNENQ